jgi:threonine dehydratase
VAVGGLASDALGASRIGDSGFASLTSVRAQSVLVRAESIERARQLLWDDMRLVVEPGGATALAALLQGAYVPAAGEQVAVVVCGANADPADMTRLPAGVRPR